MSWWSRFSGSRRLDQDTATLDQDTATLDQITAGLHRINASLDRINASLDESIAVTEDIDSKLHVLLDRSDTMVLAALREKLTREHGSAYAQAYTAHTPASLLTLLSRHHYRREDQEEWVKDHLPKLLTHVAQVFN